MHNVCLHCLMEKEHWLFSSDLISNSKVSDFEKEPLALMCVVDYQVIALEILVTNSERLMLTLFLKNTVFIRYDQFKLRAVRQC